MPRVIKRNVPSLRQVEVPTEKFDAILGADFHLRDDCPVCREPDEFFAAQRRKLEFIGKLCKHSDCPLLCAGDLFDHWEPSPFLLTMAFELLPSRVFIAPGQHDLQNHSLARLERTGLATLQAGGTGVLLFSPGDKLLEGYKPIYTPSYGVYGLAFGQGTADLPKIRGKQVRLVLLWHRLTCVDKQPWPDAGAETSHAVLKKFPAFDLIVTGDNHQQFFSGSGPGPKLVNPGSMMRQTADQVDFEPAVFGWVAKTNQLTRIPLPIESGVVKTDHLAGESKETRDEQMAAYVKRAARSYETRLSFTKNLEKYFKKNEESAGVREKVWAAVGD